MPGPRSPRRAAQSASSLACGLLEFPHPFPCVLCVARCCVSSTSRSRVPRPKVTDVVCLLRRDHKLIVLADVYLVGESVAFVFTPVRRRDPSSCGRDRCLSDGSGASLNVSSGPSKLNSGPVSSPASPRSLNFGLARGAGLGKMPPRPSDGLCSFSSVLSSSFHIEHKLPHDVVNLTAFERHAYGMPHAPTSLNMSFSTSAEREEVSPCTCTVVLLGKGAISSVVFLFRQWRFPPSPLHALPRGSKTIAAAETLSAHIGTAPGVWASDSQSRSKNSDVSQYSGGLSGTTSHFTLTARFPSDLRDAWVVSDKKTLQSWHNGAHWAKKRPRTTATLR